MRSAPVESFRQELSKSAQVELLLILKQDRKHVTNAELRPECLDELQLRA